MKPVKVVVLGGSGVATPELVDALIAQSGRTRPIELVLVGRSLDKLKVVGRTAQHLAAGDPFLNVNLSQDISDALKDADYVINQVRVGGLEARAHDESFPTVLGIPGEETVGPGGFANASRTIPVSVEFARLMEKICPQATMLSFANPSSLVQYAITYATKVHTVGLCDAPISLSESIAKVLNIPANEMEVDYVGMHHFGWVVGLRWHGQDMLPAALDKVDKIAPEVDPVIPHAIGAIPGHYLNYIFHPDRMLAKKAGKPTRAEELLKLQAEILKEMEDPASSGKPAALEKRKARWYRAIIAPVLTALIESQVPGNHKEYPYILNVVNHKTIPWLPETAVIEVPCIIRHGEVHAKPVGEVPVDVKTLIQVNCTYEMLAAQAIIEKDRSKALRALLLNPMIPNYDLAANVLEKAWDATALQGL